MKTNTTIIKTHFVSAYKDKQLTELSEAVLFDEARQRLEQLGFSNTLESDHIFKISVKDFFYEQVTKKDIPGLVGYQVVGYIQIEIIERVKNG